MLTKYPPRPIRLEQELENTQKVIDSLLDKAKLSEDESGYLNVLGTLVDEYGVDFLKALLSEFG